MLKASRAFLGSDAALVTPARDDHIASGLSLGHSAITGFKAAIRASVEPGPVISMLPISNRRSSTITWGFCIFETFSSSFHNCKKAAGWTLRNNLRLAFFFAEADPTSIISGSSCFAMAHHTSVTGAIGCLHLSLSNTQHSKLLVPSLHRLPLLPHASSLSTPRDRNKPSKLASTPSSPIVEI